ncbi:MAG: dihydroorotate dehydrogenase electron transfer subunit [Candidatus Korarchaeota archaeon]|nr:dihydroorotate dehydrogenase electron transfer subunit [Thermoproteota archaeon]MCR8462921.1 dihydroorotate dehydrogenase electron transfer subunit [Thermoproteota archaeon]MCR8470393.1 dihydroorotate dehydrogenase electron transfer subunit [Thermoproteota archaeon]MCR8472146.1 dihydroorotate dehydrogenase electron transfer subunit [Thermoproteota archaeon]MCR8472931.1 dihydroorotate dehydrogenase electron transfer subunit [Thermoproteota archaeon]
MSTLKSGAHQGYLVDRSKEIVGAEIIKSVRENVLVKSIYLRPFRPLAKPKPGQFVMIWVPNMEEIPMSVSGFYGDHFRISVASVGPTTRVLNELPVGTLVGVKGFLGNALQLGNKKYLLVGGGYGVAPLVYAMAGIRNSHGEAQIVIGARTRDLLLFLDEAKRFGKVHISTDDGSEGFHGTALDLAKEILSSESFDEVIVCGPEPLLIGVSELCSEYNIQAYVLAERYMKCGIGLCGSCVLDGSGLLVCRDGPVFDARIYLKALRRKISKN